MTFFYILSVVFGLLTFSIFLIAYKYSKNANSYTECMLAIGGLAIFSLLTTFFSASWFDAIPKPNWAEPFGQFGDFIGGILNPIFGLITILLVLNTLKLQGRDVASAKRSREYERLESQISLLKSNFDAYISSNTLLVDIESETYLRPIKPDVLTDGTTETGRKTLVNICATMNAQGSPDYLSFDVADRNRVAVHKAERIVQQIVTLYKDLIDDRELDTINLIHIQRLDSFLIEVVGLGLKPLGHYHRDMKVIESKLKKLPYGYQRSLPEVFTSFVRSDVNSRD